MLVADVGSCEEQVSAGVTFNQYCPGFQSLFGGCTSN